MTSKPPTLIVQTEPICVDAADAGRLFGFSARTWKRMVIAHRAPAPIKVGRSNRWRVAELRAWAAAGCPDDWQAAIA